MFEKDALGFKVLKESLSVLRKDKKLLLLPFFTLTLAGILLVLLGVVLLKVANSVEGTPAIWVSLALIVAYVFVLTIVSIFFRVAMAYAAYLLFCEKTPSLAGSIGYSFKNGARIVRLALFLATVAVAIVIVQKIMPKRIVRMLFPGFLFTLEFTWSVLTFFLLPVFVIERKGVLPSLKDSSALIKKRWGAAVVGSFAFDYAIVFGVLGLMALSTAFLVLGKTTVGLSLLVGGVIVFIVLATIFSVLKEIFTMALYLYAKTGKVLSEMSEELLRGAFKQKK